MSVTRTNKLKYGGPKLEAGAKEGLILAGTLIAQRAQGLVHVQTGRLKRSITRGNPYPTSNGQAIDVGSNLIYSGIEEFREGEKDGTPHAYLRPAIKASERAAITIIAKRILSKLVQL